MIALIIESERQSCIMMGEAYSLSSLSSLSRAWFGKKCTNLLHLPPQKKKKKKKQSFSIFSSPTQLALIFTDTAQQIQLASNVFYRTKRKIEKWRFQCSYYWPSSIYQKTKSLVIFEDIEPSSPIPTWLISCSNQLLITGDWLDVKLRFYVKNLNFALLQDSLQ